MNQLQYNVFRQMNNKLEHGGLVPFHSEVQSLRSDYYQYVLHENFLDIA